VASVFTLAGCHNKPNSENLINPEKSNLLIEELNEHQNNIYNDSLTHEERVENTLLYTDKLLQLLRNEDASNIEDEELQNLLEYKIHAFTQQSMVNDKSINIRIVRYDGLPELFGTMERRWTFIQWWDGKKNGAQVLVDKGAEIVSEFLLVKTSSDQFVLTLAGYAAVYKPYPVFISTYQFEEDSWNPTNILGNISEINDDTWIANVHNNLLVIENYIDTSELLEINNLPNGFEFVSPADQRLIATFDSNQIHFKTNTAITKVLGYPYKEITALQNLSITPQSISSEIDLSLLDPVSYSPLNYLSGVGELVAGEPRKIYRYDLDVGGGLVDYRELEYYTLPDALGANLSLTRISLERGILLDRDNGYLIVIGYDNIPGEYGYMRKTFLKAIQFVDKTVAKEIRILGGYVEDGSSRAVVAKSDRSINVIEVDTLQTIHISAPSEWIPLSLISAINKNQVWQIDEDNTKTRLLDIFKDEVIAEFDLKEKKVHGKVTQVRGNDNLVYIATKLEGKSYIYSVSNHHTAYIDRFDTFGDGIEDNRFGEIDDIWEFHGNGQTFYFAIFQRNSHYPIRLVDQSSDDWMIVNKE